MAIAGNTTTAYRCTLVGGQLTTGNSRMVGGDMCVKPSVALTILRAGHNNSVIVAGSDLVELCRLLKGEK